MKIIKHAILEKPFCSYKFQPPQCDSYRCPIGNCLSDKEICDGKKDCHDGSDELPEICKIYRKCNVNEIKCENHKCVLRSQFCDMYDDCGDSTDEPVNCKCIDYLK